jgi:hypothetical protein
MCVLGQMCMLIMRPVIIYCCFYSFPFKHHLVSNLKTNLIPKQDLIATSGQEDFFLTSLFLCVRGFLFVACVANEVERRTLFTFF